VLLDNFVSASSAIEEEEAQILLENKKLRKMVRNPLEPLLKKIAREFIDDSDLTIKLRHLYKVCLPRPLSTGRCLVCQSSRSAVEDDEILS
jgi:hypothetical protein